MARPLGAVHRQKKGRRLLRDWRPRYRAYTPDWEESVPNRARDPFTVAWLNGALMAQGGLVSRAVGDAARLGDIMEWQAVRDSLRVDPQRARGHKPDLTAPKATVRAAIL